jgi:predicted LPLAT superfamily acyltransferase
MSRTDNTSRLGIHDRQRIFSSPVARAFVRIVVARRSVTEAKARKIYLDYLNRAQPVGDHGRREDCVM